MTRALGIRQRLLLGRLRRDVQSWHDVTGREVPAAHALARRGFIAYNPAQGIARAEPLGPRQWPGAELMRGAQGVRDRV